MSYVESFPVVKKGGFDPVAVEAYATRVENQLNDYRMRESAISSAVISAQIVSDRIIKEAKDEAALLVTESNNILLAAKQESSELLKVGELAVKEMKETAEAAIEKRKAEVDSYCKSLISDAEERANVFDSEIISKVEEAIAYVESKRDFVKNLKDDTSRILRAYLSTMDQGELDNVIDMFEDLAVNIGSFSKLLLNPSLEENIND